MSGRYKVNCGSEFDRDVNSAYMHVHMPCAGRPYAGPALALYINNTDLLRRIQNNMHICMYMLDYY